MYPPHVPIHFYDAYMHRCGTFRFLKVPGGILEGTFKNLKVHVQIFEGSGSVPPAGLNFSRVILTSLMKFIGSAFAADFWVPGFYEDSIDFESEGWKWVSIHGNGYANTTYISEFRP